MKKLQIQVLHEFELFAPAATNKFTMLALRLGVSVVMPFPAIRMVSKDYEATVTAAINLKDDVAFSGEASPASLWCSCLYKYWLRFYCWCSCFLFQICNTYAVSQHKYCDANPHYKDGI